MEPQAEFSNVLGALFVRIAKCFLVICKFHKDWKIYNSYSSGFFMAMFGEA